MRDNIVSKLLFVIGISLMVVGLLTGIIIAASGLRYGLNPVNGMMWSVLFTYFFAGLVLGLLFVGLSEIVHLLHNLNGKLSLLEKNHWKTHPAGSADQQIEESYTAPSAQPYSRSNQEWELPQMDRNRVVDYYSDQELLEIIPSNEKDYCVVKLLGEDGRAFVRVVDVRGSSIAEVQDSELKKKIIAWYNHMEG